MTARGPGLNEMTKENLTDRQIRLYLLGGLPEDAAERIDELSFSDDFAERIGIVEDELVDAYVASSLECDEAEAFDRHYLSSTRRRRKLDFAEVLAAERWEMSHSEPLARPAGKGSIFELFGGWRRALQFGLAAAGLIVAASVGWMFTRNGPPVGGDAIAVTGQGANVPPPTQKVPSAATPAVAALPSLTPVPSPVGNKPIDEPKTRPEQKDAGPTRPNLAVIVLSPALRNSSTKEIRAGGRPSEFQLRLESEAAGPFSVEVTSLSGASTIWSAKGLSARGTADRRTVHFRVPAGKIADGEYRVTLKAMTGEGTEAKVGEYNFRIVQ